MNRHIYTIFTLVLCTVFCYPVFAQNIEINDAVQAPYTPESLIRNYFIGEGIEIVSIDFKGENTATGYFSNGLNDVGLDEGIILATGKLDRFNAPSTVESSTLTSDENVTDQELADIIGANLLKDVVTYEITFIPSADSIQFNYVFASEEYPEYVCSDYNDVFGFFISGPNPSGGQYTSQNIAIVPGTTDLSVSINNVNNGTIGSSGNQNNCDPSLIQNNSQFYNDNTSEHLIFDGILDPFVAAAPVIPCETYTIKFSIGDVSDFLKDSAVFLEGKSFSSNMIQFKTITASENGTVTEGCSSAFIEFELPQNATTNETFTLEFLGTAENGIDYENISTSIIIPSGQKSASIEIVPLEDELEENTESIGIVIMNGACSADTIWLGIEDNKLIPPAEQGPIFLCDNGSNQVDFTIPVVSDTLIVFRNQNETRIEPINEPVYSTITVQDVYPSTLNKSNLLQVCIDELSHPWIEDLSIYLYGPNNQFIELSTKNGGNGGNGTQNDFFLNTCFTIDATTLISDPLQTPPYIGSFQPEGNWDDFMSSNSYKVNGEWRLMMIDDFQGSIGTLSSWSIQFQRSYDISYSWSPSDGISCTDCPNPTFDSDVSQLYTLNIDDTNGCSLEYDVMVNANDDTLAAPEISCQNTDTGEITFSWDAVPGAESYMINVDNEPFQSIGLDSTYTLAGLPAGSEVSFEIQAIGTCSESEVSTQFCSTMPCGIELNIVSSLDPDCDSADSGMILVSAGNGAEPYTYSYAEESNTTGEFNNLAAGEYNIEAIDNNGCLTDIIVNLLGKTSILIDGEIEHIECGEETGSIDLSVTGGQGQLQFTWSDNFSGSVASLESGTYELLVTDEAGCTATKEFTIETVADFTAEFDILSPACANDTTGSIQVILEDMALIEDIVWSNGQEGSFIENLSAGSYSVVISNNDGCTLTKSIELNPGTVLDIEMTTTDNICHGESIGAALLSPSGGVSPYQISWSNNQTGERIENLNAGQYMATITDTNGCIIIDTVDIKQPTALSLEDMIIEEPSCTVDKGSIDVFAAGGTAPYSLSINNKDYQSESYFQNLEPGQYNVNIQDSNGCQTTSEELVNIPEYDDLILFTEELIYLSLGDSVDLFAYVSNRNDDLVYEWSTIDSQYLSCLNCQEPTFSGVTTTSILVTAIDKDGCETTENVVVQVQSNKNIFVPNAFSPNGDGINDRFSVFAKEDIISTLNDFSIYDSWGNQVYQSSNLEVNNMNSGWDGYYKGNQMNNGVFVWQLAVTYIDGQTEILSGNVTLTR